MGSAQGRRQSTKHGVSFARAASVLLDPLALTKCDRARSDDEEHWFTLGMSVEGRLLAVSHTYQSTGPNSASVRLISARMATTKERHQYENEPQ